MKRVVLIDDLSSVLEVLQEMFIRCGVHCVAVTTAEDGLQALQAPGDWRLVTDFRLGKDTTGLDVIGRAKQVGYTDRAAIVSGELASCLMEIDGVPTKVWSKPLRLVEVQEIMAWLFPV